MEKNTTPNTETITISPISGKYWTTSNGCKIIYCDMVGRYWVGDHVGLPIGATATLSAAVEMAATS